MKKLIKSEPLGRQKVTLETNGEFKESKLFIDEKPIYFEAISISGGKQTDLDITVVICQSKATDLEIEQALQSNTLPDAIGFNCLEANEFDCDDDEIE